jgi:hypothetical protein
MGSSVATTKKAPVATKSSLRIREGSLGVMMFSSQTDFGVLLKEFRTKVNLKGVKLNTNFGNKEGQKQQKV